MAVLYEHYHPDYAADAARRRLHLDLYDGGPSIETNSAYLTPHPFETAAQFAIRRQRATYRNFAAPIVDVFTTGITSSRPPRELAPSLVAIERDADRAGTSADVFFAEVVRLCAAGGAHFVLVDMERTQGGTRAEDLANGRRSLPYFVSVPADSVIDWGEAPDGGLEWAVLRGRRYETPGPFCEGAEVDSLTVWSRSQWAVYEQRGGKGFSLMRHGDHPLGQVPLVPFLFENKGLMRGVSCLDDVASLILRVFRKDSELDKMLFDCAVPLLHGRGINRDEAANFVRSSSNVLVSGTDTSLGYVEPAGASYAAIAGFISKDEDAIREIGLRQLRQPSLAGQTAEAKRLDGAQLDSQLARFAAICQSAEERCWRLAGHWLGQEIYPKTPYAVTLSEGGDSMV